MEELIRGINDAVNHGSWHGALALSLVMPNICGGLAYPELVGPGNGRSRYEKWYAQYVLPKYIIEIGPDHKKHTFLTGSDCYALRCAYLHEGSFDISSQKAQVILANFTFVRPKPGRLIHNNQFNDTLQLQVDSFAHDMATSASEWWESIGESSRSKMNNRIMTIA